jgi:hypothetical protein
VSIVAVWSLKRGIIDPPEPLENSEAIEYLWWEQDHPIESKRASYWGTLRRELPTAFPGR